MQENERYNLVSSHDCNIMNILGRIIHTVFDSMVCTEKGRINDRNNNSSPGTNAAD